MGCHTWFYKKIDVTYEEAKFHLIKVYTDEIELLQKWVDNPLDEDYLEMLEFYPEYTFDFIFHNLEVYKRKLRMVENGYCKEAVMNKYSDGTFKVHHYIKNKGMYKSLDWCDIFRIGNYPTDKLFSLEETLDFIERNKDNIYGYHYNDVSKKDWKEQLEDYWKEYPDGMIDFG